MIPSALFAAPPRSGNSTTRKNAVALSSTDISDSRSSRVSGARTGSFRKSIRFRRESGVAWRWSVKPTLRAKQSSPTTCISKARVMTDCAVHNLRRPSKIAANIVRAPRFCSPGTSTWTSQAAPWRWPSAVHSFRMLLRISTGQRHRTLSSRTDERLTGSFREAPFARANPRSTGRCRLPTTILSRPPSISPKDVRSLGAPFLPADAYRRICGVTALTISSPCVSRGPRACGRSRTRDAE